MDSKRFLINAPAQLVVRKSGDRLSGSLSVSYSSPRFVIQRPFLACALLGFVIGSSGCSSSEGYVDYSTLDRLPQESPTDSAEQWVVQPAAKNDADEPAKDIESAKEGPPESTPTTDTADGPSKQAPAAQIDANQTTPTPTGVQMTSAAGQDLTSVQPAVAKSDINEPAAVDDSDSPTEPREIELLIPEKRFRTEGDNDLLRISYDDIDLLQVLNMEPVPVDAVDYFPQWLKDLNGQRIRLRGFMFPTFVATGIKNFGLARDNGICCFVKQPKIYDMIEVNLADDESTDYIEGKPFDVEGIFRIEPEADDTELFQLYRISDAKVLK